MDMLICTIRAGIAAQREEFSSVAMFQGEASGHLAFISEQITEATLRESLLHWNHVTGRPVGE